MADVNRFLNTAADLLKSGATDKKAETLNKAINLCKTALTLLEKVEGVSEEARSRKSSDIMSTIYWCRKMMPLDLGGRALTSGAGADEAAKSKGSPPKQPPTNQPKPPPNKKGPEIDEISFNRAKAFAAKNPDDLPSIALRYEGVAASFQRSKWGKKASEEAARARAKLKAMRAAMAKGLKDSIQRFELDIAVAMIDGFIRTATSSGKKQELLRMKADVGRLGEYQQNLVKMLEALHAKLGVEFAALGLEGKGWVKGGGADGIRVSVGTRIAPEKTMPWSKFGARAAVLLGEQTLSLSDPDNLAILAVSATIAEDYITAQRLFEKLLLSAPRRAIAVTTYFDRAQTGYRTSAEGNAAIRFKKAKDLARARKAKEAVLALTELQRDLAKNSALQDFLFEIDTYRRLLMRQKNVNERGEPLSLFEKKVRRVFGGDVKLDEDTGEIEVVYDFSRRDQFKDWTLVLRFNAPARTGWTISNGQARCLGGKALLMWKFPISRFDLSADVVYEDRTGEKRTVIYACLCKNNILGIWAWCRKGQARFGYGSIDRNRYYDYYYSSTRNVWRPGEVATLRFTHNEREGYNPFSLTVNDNYATSGSVYYRNYPEKGCLAFGFDGGRGSVDNVVIKGELDMAWFRQLTSGIR